MSDWQKEKASGGQAILHASTAAIVMPEFLVDTILRDHELAFAHGALSDGCEPMLKALKAAEAEAAALRAVARDILAAWDDGLGWNFDQLNEACGRAESILSGQAEAPATAGEG